MQAVQTFRRKRHCRFKTERHHRAVQIIVNRFRNTNHAQTFFGKHIRNFHRTVATNRNQRIQFVQFKRAHQFIRTVNQFHLAIFALDGIAQRIVAIRRAQNRAAEMRNPAHAFARQTHQPAVNIMLGQKQTIETITNAVHFPPVIDCGKRRRANHRIQTGRVAAAGTDCDSLDTMCSTHPMLNSFDVPFLLERVRVKVRLNSCPNSFRDFYASLSGAMLTAIA